MIKLQNPVWNLPPKVYAGIGGLLLLAVAPLPYGYYTFMKIVVCGFSSVLAYQNFTLSNAKNPAWPWVFLFIAIAFNPVIPIHMQKEIWMVVDAATGILFCALAWKTKTSEKDFANREKN